MNSLTSVIESMSLLLKKSNCQLVTAESCTGGLIASYLTEFPGCSSWFERGFVTYSNRAKEDMLGVPAKLITQFGAVSQEVALAMAKGALQFSQGQISVSVTGIAGPDGGSQEKPVGTVHLAWASAHQLQSIKKQFSGTRQDIRLAACQQALEGVILFLQDH